MDIWVLVIILLVIAVILLVASIFAPDPSEQLADRLDELTFDQAAEIEELQRQIQELELGYQPVAPIEVTDVYVEETIDLSDQLSETDRETIIQLYSQGFTMQEIAQEVHSNVHTIQIVVDDYIESR